MDKPQEVTSFCPPFISSSRMLLAVVVPRQIITWERPTHLFIDYSNDHYCFLLQIAGHLPRSKAPTGNVVVSGLRTCASRPGHLPGKLPVSGIRPRQNQGKKDLLILRMYYTSTFPLGGCFIYPKQMCSLIPFKC